MVLQLLSTYLLIHTFCWHLLSGFSFAITNHVPVSIGSSHYVKVFTTNNRSWYDIPYAFEIVDHWFRTQTKWSYQTCVSQNKYNILICKLNHGQITNTLYSFVFWKLALLQTYVHCKNISTQYNISGIYADIGQWSWLSFTQIDGYLNHQRHPRVFIALFLIPYNPCLRGFSTMGYNNPHKPR